VTSKVMTMAEAIGRFVPDGATVALGTALEPLIPFAAGHQLIRQGRRDLELVGPISDALFDQLIGAGSVRRITAAWVGNVSEGLGHCYRRAAEERIPRSIEVHDIVDTNPNLRVADGLVHINAVRPDVALVHVQRADTMGRAHAWGPLGITEEAGLAAQHIVISCEELVDESVTLSDPNRILFPETKVVGVVHEPGGAHPSPVQGYFKRDHSFFRNYAMASRTADGFAEWLERWVLEVPDRAAYLKQIDVEALRVKGTAPSEPANFADE